MQRYKTDNFINTIDHCNGLTQLVQTHLHCCDYSNEIKSAIAGIIAVLNGLVKDNIFLREEILKIHGVKTPRNKTIFN